MIGVLAYLFGYAVIWSIIEGLWFVINKAFHIKGEK